MFALDWCVRMPRSRALRIGDAGREGLHEQFGIDL
jgi:hypothetical protein